MADESLEGATQKLNTRLQQIIQDVAIAPDGNTSTNKFTEGLNRLQQEGLAQHLNGDNVEQLGSCALLNGVEFNNTVQKAFQDIADNAHHQDNGVSENINTLLEGVNDPNGTMTATPAAIIDQVDSLTNEISQTKRGSTEYNTASGKLADIASKSTGTDALIRQTIAERHGEKIENNPEKYPPYMRDISVNNAHGSDPLKVAHNLSRQDGFNAKEDMPQLSTKTCAAMLQGKQNREETLRSMGAMSDGPQGGKAVRNVIEQMAQTGQRLHSKDVENMLGATPNGLENPESKKTLSKMVNTGAIKKCSLTRELAKADMLNAEAKANTLKPHQFMESLKEKPAENLKEFNKNTKAVDIAAKKMSTKTGPASFVRKKAFTDIDNFESARKSLNNMDGTPEEKRKAFSDRISTQVSGVCKDNDKLIAKEATKMQPSYDKQGQLSFENLSTYTAKTSPDTFDKLLKSGTDPNNFSKIRSAQEENLRDDASEIIRNGHPKSKEALYKSTMIAQEAKKNDLQTNRKELKTGPSFDDNIHGQNRIKEALKQGDTMSMAMEENLHQQPNNQKSSKIDRAVAKASSLKKGGFCNQKVFENMGKDSAMCDLATGMRSENGDKLFSKADIKRNAKTIISNAAKSDNPTKSLYGLTKAQINNKTNLNKQTTALRKKMEKKIKKLEKAQDKAKNPEEKKEIAGKLAEAEKVCDFCHDLKHATNSTYRKGVKAVKQGEKPQTAEILKDKMPEGGKMSEAIKQHENELKTLRRNAENMRKEAGIEAFAEDNAISSPNPQHPNLTNAINQDIEAGKIAAQKHEKEKTAHQDKNLATTETTQETAKDGAKEETVPKSPPKDTETKGTQDHESNTSKPDKETVTERTSPATSTAQNTQTKSNIQSNVPAGGVKASPDNAQKTNNNIESKLNEQSQSKLKKIQETLGKAGMKSSAGETKSQASPSSTPQNKQNKKDDLER